MKIKLTPLDSIANIKRNREKGNIEISEKNFEELVKELARVNNWLYYHTYRSTRSVPGFPDCVMVRGKRTIYAELKTEKGKVTPPQQQWLEALSNAGNETFLWRPSDFEEMCEILTATTQLKKDGEAETRKSLAEGKGITFNNANEAIKWLKGEAR